MSIGTAFALVGVYCPDHPAAVLRHETKLKSDIRRTDSCPCWPDILKNCHFLKRYIKHTDQYCFRYLDDRIHVASCEKQVALACTNASSSAKMVDVSNNYIGFFLTKRTSIPVPGPILLSQRDRGESLKRCKPTVSPRLYV
jgi:hypothetical protein